MPQYTRTISIVVVGLVVVFALPLFVQLTEKLDEPQPGNAPLSAKWNSNNIPVGQWSSVVAIPIGCRVRFSFVPDAHRVQYQFYSKEWSEYKAGTSPDMSHLRFMALKPNLTQVPYEVTCPAK